MSTKEGRRLCFVVSPIGSDDSAERAHADWLLEGIIEPAMSGFGFEVRRADQIATPGLIDSQIIDALLEADLVIADLSTLNPNVFYEIGIRHMRQKPIIHMHLAGGAKIPFDVSLFRSIEFSRNKPSDLRIARDRLKAAVTAVRQDAQDTSSSAISSKSDRLILQSPARSPSRSQPR